MQRSGFGYNAFLLIIYLGAFGRGGDCVRLLAIRTHVALLRACDSTLQAWKGLYRTPAPALAAALLALGTLPLRPPAWSRAWRREAKRTI